MKKFICVLSAIMLMTVLALPALAYDYWDEAVTVNAAYGTPTIDGAIGSGEWDSAPEIKTLLNGDALEANGYVLYQAAWETERSDSDYSGMFKIMWDENFLYILEVRKDNVVNLAGDANAAYLTDGTLVFLMPADDGSSANSVNPDATFHHIFYSVGNGSGAIGGMMVDRMGDNTSGTEAILDPAGIAGGKIASALTDAGYLEEIAVPWSELAQGLTDAFKGPSDNMKLGFSLVVHDSDLSDGTTAFEKQFCWAKMDSKLPAAGYDFGGWGVLVLNAKPVVTEAPATEAPATETPATEGNGETTAPTTADFAAVAVFVACVTAAGAYIISRKKK